jgi:hypothetical protein
MMTLGLKEFDRLDGASNFVPWKFRLQILWRRLIFWYNVEKEMVAPTNPKILAIHFKNEAKEMLI